MGEAAACGIEIGRGGKVGEAAACGIKAGRGGKAGEAGLSCNTGIGRDGKAVASC